MLFKKEILRFVIVGIIATIVDYIFYSLFAFLAKIWGVDSSFWVTFIATTAGFIAGVIINYILSIKWVFQDVDKEKKMNPILHSIIFVVLSAVGLLLGIGIMFGFKSLYIATLNVDIDTWMIVSEGTNWLVGILTSSTFYLFTLSFIIKTLIVLTYNYISRKKILFKSKQNKEN